MRYLRTFNLFLIPLLSFLYCFTPSTKNTPSSTHETNDISKIEVSDLVILKKSKIPGAGIGVYAAKDIAKDSIVGEYKGKFLSDEEYKKLVDADEWHYVMGLNECSYKYTNGIRFIDGRNGNFTTRMNYAPTEFQNVKFQKVCEKPFVVVVALRNIKKDEEIYIDYGPDYIYDFMEFPDVKNYFETERKKLKK
jgi:SET domain-containing protein